MTASLRRTVIVSMAALGVAVLLAWATVTGPGEMVGELPSAVETTSSPTPQPTARPTDDGQQDGSRRSGDRAEATSWGSDVLTAVGLIGGLWLLAMVARALAARLAAYLPEKQLVVDLETLPDVDAGREALARDRERHRAALTGSGVRNGIVACWLLLEEAAAVAGVVRRPAETATEFVVRFLHALDVDPRPVAELAGLYHEARFSTHPLGEDARRHALDALDGIHHDLAGRVG